MKSVFRLLPFLFLLGLSAYLPGVRAETCRANIGQTTVNIPNIKYLPTLQVAGKRDPAAVIRHRAGHLGIDRQRG